MTNNEQIQAAAADLRDRVSRKMGDIWWAFLLRGLFAIALGLSILIWPELTLGLHIRFIGLFALLDGLAGIVAGIRSRNLTSYLIPAMVSLTVGAVLLFWPGVTVKWLLVFLGIWALLMGASLFYSGHSAAKSDPNAPTFTAMGAVLAVIGLVLIFWPGMGVATIIWLVAGLAFLVGVLLIFLALKLRGVNQRLENIGDAH